MDPSFWLIAASTDTANRRPLCFVLQVERLFEFRYLIITLPLSDVVLLLGSQDMPSPLDTSLDRTLYLLPSNCSHFFWIWKTLISRVVAQMWCWSCRLRHYYHAVRLPPWQDPHRFIRYADPDWWLVIRKAEALEYIVKLSAQSIFRLNSNFACPSVRFVLT